MQQFIKETGLVVPLDRSNVDTDQIIPKQFLKKIERTGFGIHLFHDWRFLDDAGQKINPDFILNQSRYQGAQILVAGDNFGCGSSREHAPWALLDYGFRSIIAPSFADIFYNNCFNNGLLPIVLDTAAVDALFTEVRELEGHQLDISLVDKKIVKPCGGIIEFDLDPFLRERLLNGWDHIDLTLRHEAKIDAFEKATQR